MAIYLLNSSTGEILPLGACKYYVVRNPSEALYDAIEDVDFRIPEPMKLVQHPESSVPISFDLTTKGFE